MKMHFDHDVEVDAQIEEEINLDGFRDLVVYNDDFNTFDHVIETLIKVCKHASQQAEQCTYIIHYKGKCAVKNGSFLQLRPMRQGIADAGLKAVIE